MMIPVTGGEQHAAVTIIILNGMSTVKNLANSFYGMNPSQQTQNMCKTFIQRRHQRLRRWPNIV